MVEKHQVFAYNVEKVDNLIISVVCTVTKAEVFKENIVSIVDINVKKVLKEDKDC